MRSLLVTILMAATMCTVVAQAQSGGSAATAPEGEFLGRFTVSLSHGMKSAKTASTLADAQVAITYTVMRVGLRTDIEIDISTIKFNGDCPWVDDMSTIEFFDMLAHLAMSQAIEEGTLKCSVLSETVRVVVPACVRRTGSGSETAFQGCTTGGQCAREYQVSCPLELTVPVYKLVDILRLLGGGSAQCDAGSGCEPTCP